MGKRRSLKADRIHAPEARTPDGPGVAQTRALILRQATELFAERGYGRVTVADIASAAGVAARATAAYRDALIAAAPHLHTLAPAPSRTVEETAGLLWFWFGPTGWRTLVVENGWSWDQAESVLCRTAIATLH
ncbi:TetR family transcriptional regulator [Streptomyces sp. NPDC021225]|uniref:TetR family transcriptional regulator n=1 Tax=Streptomyces sp. NPDC021225 TaxID=3365121 RepID=UPI0037A6EBC1